MSTLTYTRFEMLRVLRNRQGLFFSILFPVIFYFLLAGPNKDNHNFGGTKQAHRLTIGHRTILTRSAAGRRRRANAAHEG